MTTSISLIDWARKFVSDNNFFMRCHVTLALVIARVDAWFPTRLTSRSFKCFTATAIFTYKKFNLHILWALMKIWLESAVGLLVEEKTKRILIKFLVFYKFACYIQDRSLHCISEMRVSLLKFIKLFILQRKHYNMHILV
jgi:hypothetical protein